jgi:hypothetical protein
MLQPMMSRVTTLGEVDSTTTLRVLSPCPMVTWSQGCYGD